jgi:hypothetical protein
MVTCSLGAGVGVDGVETAAACLRVLMPDMVPYRNLWVEDLADVACPLVVLNLAIWPI